MHVMVTEECSEEEPVRLQRLPDLPQSGWEVVNPMQTKARYHDCTRTRERRLARHIWMRICFQRLYLYRHIAFQREKTPAALRGLGCIPRRQAFGFSEWLRPTSERRLINLNYFHECNAAANAHLELVQMLFASISICDTPKRVL